MLERYYLRPDTIDRIRASWVAEAIEQYVAWLTEHRYAPRNVFRRVPILRHFGDFASAQGATAWEQLPEQLPVHVDAFVDIWVCEHGQSCRSERARRKVADEARNPIQQCSVWWCPTSSGAAGPAVLRRRLRDARTRPVNRIFTPAA